MAKQRIAILGGGVGALMAAFEITDAKGWQDDYEITVYQLGWRLGGKGASGRNADHEQRIEEHGLHILLGFYENAFKVLRKAYGELGRAPGTPLATWQDAFKPHNYVVLTEQLQDGSYVPWVMDFPPNSGVPGDGGVLPTPGQLVEMIIGWLKQIFDRSKRLPDNHPNLDAAHLHAKLGNHDKVLDELEKVHDWLHRKIRGEEDKLEEKIDWRRDFVTCDLGFAATRGMIDSGVVKTGDWFSQDYLDFRAWLSKYGAHDVSVNSAYITGMYDLGFSLPGQVGAGTAINGILRMCWTYKGAVMWKMQAGMGDTIFVPLYQVLKNRGVKFEFFHRVDELTLSREGTYVETITIGRQATAKSGAYDPLVEVLDLDCWPSEPKYELLNEGDALKSVNLEDWWTDWKDPVPPLVLTYGAETNGFDRVILGCSIGIFEYIAKDVITKNKPFRDMVANVKTTQTQAAQLWLERDLAGLGWTLNSPVLDGYAEPMDTWADMTHLLVREDWSRSPVVPKNLAYLCSPLPDTQWPLPPRTEHDYATKQNEMVKANALSWLTKSSAGLWPATQKNGDFNWNLLVGSNATGPARFDSQYWIATWNPSDRYVLAMPNSVNFRLTTQGHGIGNLYLAGDYVKTGMNVGCVEAATMGGMHASRAICGRPEHIVGDLTDEQEEASKTWKPSPGLPDSSGSSSDSSGSSAGSGSSSAGSSSARPHASILETIIEGTTEMVTSIANAASDVVRQVASMLAGHRPGASSSGAGASSTNSARASVRPPYIQRGGDLAMMPPLTLTNATMYSFLVNADIGALTAMCDAHLNAVTAASGVTYKPLMPAVSIVCADIKKSYSTTKPDSQKGWMAERDFGVWVPVVDNKGRIAWYLPYVFVDNVAAMVTGREVFGFFKQTATLVMPPTPQSPGDFTIDALVIQTFSPQSEAKDIRLLTASSTKSGPAPEGKWASTLDGLEMLWKDLLVLRGDTRNLPLTREQEFRDALVVLLTGNVPMVFLKQFRDETTDQRACYQAVIEAPARLDKFHGGWVTHPHDIAIAPADSHPIAKDCGLASGTLRSQVGFWCQMDFTMMPGRVIAQR
ncbi:MAG: acetoacetate decarboxylase family protein [Kofleriaceae bacterium]